MKTWEALTRDEYDAIRDLVPRHEALKSRTPAKDAMRTLLLLILLCTTAQAADYPVLFLAHPLDPASLSVKCSEPMAGREAGAELADLFTRAGDVWRLDHPAAGMLTVSIRDNQQAPGAEAGNLTKIVRVVSLSDSPEEPEPEPEVWTPANLGPPFMGDDTLRVRNGLIEALQ